MAELNLRCAVVARENGYLPAGSAASAAIFVLVEVPLPWPADVADHPMLRELAAVVGPHGARLQALVPDVATPEDRTRVVLYRRPDGPFRRYSRDELLVGPGELVDAVAAALADDSRGVHDDLVDVLVCTHGTRDICCGGEGMRAYAKLAVLQLPGVRVWRTSHTGGHRFAPTAVLFPDGRAWASIEPDLVADIIDRSADPRVAAAHDRGCTAFGDPFAQAAETAVLAEEGWSWLDRSRTVDSTLVDEDRRVVTVSADDGAIGYRAEVVVRRIVPVPDCGKPLEEARKTSPELEVVSLTRL